MIHSGIEDEVKLHHKFGSITVAKSFYSDTAGILIIQNLDSGQDAAAFLRRGQLLALINALTDLVEVSA